LFHTKRRRFLALEVKRSSGRNDGEGGRTELDGNKKSAKRPPIGEDRTSPTEEAQPKQSLGLRGIFQRSEFSVSPPKEGAERLEPMALGARQLPFYEDYEPW